MKKLKTRLWKIFTLMSTKQQKYSDKEITFISETFEEPIYIYFLLKNGYNEKCFILSISIQQPTQVLNQQNKA